MPAYNFKARFAEAVSTGKKRQTIRVPRKHGNAIAGEPISLYTGMRTKDCRRLLFPDPVCKQVREIWINPRTCRILMRLDDEEAGVLHAHQVEQLAIDDGFACFQDFFEFFSKEYGDAPIQMLLIEW